MNKSALLFGLMMTFLTACSSTASKPQMTTLRQDSPQQQQFDQGVKAIDAERYADAADIFDRLVVEKPGTEMELVAVFNSGVSYEGLGNCKKASDRYRRVVRASAGKFRRIESQALFHLSMMYECMGQDAKTITALLDAQKRGKELSFEVSDAEIPARLAAAYSRLGNRQKAIEYFNRASQGLKMIVSKGTGRVRTELVGQTLYQMGKLSPSQHQAEVDPTTYLQSISMQQPYLLQAIEMHKDPWSSKAEADLKVAYENIWLFKFTDREKERSFYTRGLQTINELRNLRMPDPDQGVDSVFVTLDETQRRLQNELAHVSSTNPLTQEADRREGLKQHGRLVDPKQKKNDSTNQ